MNRAHCVEGQRQLFFSPAHVGSCMLDCLQQPMQTTTQTQNASCTEKKGIQQSMQTRNPFCLQGERQPKSWRCRPWWARDEEWPALRGGSESHCDEAAPLSTGATVGAPVRADEMAVARRDCGEADPWQQGAGAAVRQIHGGAEAGPWCAEVDPWRDEMDPWRSEVDPWRATTGMSRSGESMGSRQRGEIRRSAAGSHRSGEAGPRWGAGVAGSARSRQGGVAAFGWSLGSVWVRDLHPPLERRSYG